MSATWADDRPAAAPATVRRVAAETATAVLIALVLVAAFLIGQARQDNACRRATPTQQAAWPACHQTGTRP